MAKRSGIHKKLSLCGPWSGLQRLYRMIDIEYCRCVEVVSDVWACFLFIPLCQKLRDAILLATAICAVEIHRGGGSFFRGITSSWRWGSDVLSNTPSFLQDAHFTMFFTITLDDFI